MCSRCVLRCCQKLCGLGSNDEDENPLLVCRNHSECTTRIHNPSCVRSCKSRNLGRNGVCVAKCSKDKLAGSSKPSMNGNTPSIQKPINLDPKQKTENKRNGIPDDSFNCLNEDDIRYNNYIKSLKGNNSESMGKSTGARKKIFDPRTRNRTDHINNKQERHDDLKMSSALCHEYRRYYCETSKRVWQHLKAVDNDKPDWLINKETPTKRIGRTIHPTEKRHVRSPFTNTMKHLSGDSGDSDAVAKKSYVMGRGRKISSKMLSKSESEVGAWLDDQADVKAITVSLPEIRSKYCGALQSNKTPAQDSSLGCFRLDMDDVKTCSQLESLHLERKGSPTHNVFKTNQDTSRDTALESSTNLSAESFDDLSFGTVSFLISYYHMTKSLLVHVVGVQDMPPKGKKYFYNVMLKLSILPIEKQTQNSATVKSSDMNPYFHEDFKFLVKEPKDNVLKISAYDADLRGKYNALGHAIFQLKSVTEDEILHSCSILREPWVDLKPGRLEVTLNYDQVTKNLMVTVHRAVGLAMVTRDSQGCLKSLNLERYSTLIQVTQYCAETKLNVQQSCINNRDPQYNSSFYFNLSSKYPHENFIVISVRLKLKLNESELGRVIFGPLHFASGLKPTPWGLAVSQNQTVTSWYKMYL